VAGWLAGWLAGWRTPATDRRRSDKGILLYPIINIEFALNDLPLAAKLVELLGGGRVFQRKGNSYNLQIHDLATFPKLLHYSMVICVPLKLRPLKAPSDSRAKYI
jgi:hypothetical protein